jgi:hypothetical protein
VLAAAATGAWLWNVPPRRAEPTRAGGAPRGRARPSAAAAREGGPGGAIAGARADVDVRATPSRAVLFLAGAAMLGLAPLVVGQWLRFTSPHAYYAFAAAPWLALLAGMALAALPGGVGLALTVAVVGWNTLGLGYRRPDLNDPANWIFHRWDWPEAVRLSGVADRFADDLRRGLGGHPDSLVVLYRALPEGTFFQTEDGPAARLALADPTVRGYFINGAPYRLRSGRYEVMNFDQDSLHLVRTGIPSADRGPYGGSALASGEAGVAWAFAAYGDSAELSAFDGKYIRSAAALVAEGAAGYVRELRASGLDDSSLATAHRLSAAVLAEAPSVAEGLATVLQHPRDAAAHVLLADRFEMQRALVSAAMELRIAAALDPGRLDARFRLVDLLRRMKRYEAAERDAMRLVADLRGTPRESEAQRALDDVRRLRAAPPPP